ncbi:uncharacterized protein LOC112601981 [Melanaphis sacchari]|uniref:uncharacterized protein LOC112601981 n=1 Tax=Melanaphis sacchari TaxID=742174 RepID=UPI000DC15109|nr:uncharacterized protein LOC112601981 [Melanaphis sacchari]
MDESKSGFYQCKLSNNDAGPYFIELINDNKELIIDMNNTIFFNYTSSGNIILEDVNLKIWTQWTQWSLCSKCEVMGKKNKFGHCQISLKDNVINEINIKHKKNKKKIHVLERLMAAFDTGLPCESSLLDLFGYYGITIMNKEIRVMIEHCQVKCNKDDLFEIKDILGNVKEKVNNSAGIYSPLQIIPKMPPKVETSVIITFLNEQLNITCPGNLNSDAPYEWRVNNQIILLSNERITVDILNRLTIKNITEEDEKIFTCWQIDDLAGIVEIKLIKEFNISNQRDIYFYAVFVVLGIFVWIGFKMFFDKEAAYSRY